jgi:hypothetical protein
MQNPSGGSTAQRNSGQCSCGTGCSSLAHRYLSFLGNTFSGVGKPGRITARTVRCLCTRAALSRDRDEADWACGSRPEVVVVHRHRHQVWAVLRCGEVAQHTGRVHRRQNGRSSRSASLFLVWLLLTCASASGQTTIRQLHMLHKIFLLSRPDVSTARLLAVFHLRSIGSYLAWLDPAQRAHALVASVFVLSWYCMGSNPLWRVGPACGMSAGAGDGGLSLFWQRPSSCQCSLAG